MNCKNLIKLARTARTKAGAHAYRDRRKKKRNMRALWQIKINAFVREHDYSYSKFMDALKKEGISLDRKILADLSENTNLYYTDARFNTAFAAKSLQSSPSATILRSFIPVL